MQFKEHLVDDTIRSVYGLEVADMNGDGKKDIIMGSTGEPIIAWYEAPDWKRHLISDQHPRQYHHRCSGSDRKWCAGSDCWKRI